MGARMTRGLKMTAGLLLVAAILGACAAPRAVGQGDLTGVAGAAVAAFPSQADGEETGFAKAVRDRAVHRLGGVAGADKPAYLVQVGVALAPPNVGVSSAAGTLDDAAWRSLPPPRRPWSRKGPVRTVTLAVLDARSGKTVAWSSIRIRQGEPDAVADLLVQALRDPARG